MSKHQRKSLTTIGWREWIVMPTLGLPPIKVKVDTGARSSSLHAYNVEEILKEGRRFVRFSVCPVQKSRKKSVECEAPLLEYRKVRSSSGVVSLRPVIVTDIQLLGQRWPVEVTLANRDQMGLRMLLGRQAIRGRFIVNPGKSFLGGKF